MWSHRAENKRVNTIRSPQSKNHLKLISYMCIRAERHFPGGSPFSHLKLLSVTVLSQSSLMLETYICSVQSGREQRRPFHIRFVSTRKKLLLLILEVSKIWKSSLFLLRLCFQNSTILNIMKVLIYHAESSRQDTICLLLCFRHWKITVTLNGVHRHCSSSFADERLRPEHWCGKNLELQRLT